MSLVYSKVSQFIYMFYVYKTSVYTHTYTYVFFSIMVYYKILNIVPCVI